jgi:hypothetical protein
MDKELTKENVQRIIEQSIGTENYYKHSLTGLLYTDGVKEIADLGAYWLIDAIASYQYKMRGVEFQVWELKVDERNNSAVLIGKDDDIEIIRQKISYTDFPCSIKFYVVDGVLMLPSEY